MNIEALIRHNNAPDELKKELQTEFKEVWEREISFLEEEEITGFKSTSTQIFFAASYMLALATFVDFNYLKGIEISSKLLKYINQNKDYKEFESKVKKLLASSYFMQSRVLYFQGDFENSIRYRREFHSLTPDDYDSYLNEAIFYINRRNDPETAMEFVEKARKIAKGNGTWKYSKLYLLIRLEKYPDALKVLDMIITTKFKNEFDVINQVINYNLHCLENDPCHIQSLFIIGVLIYKKLGNAPFAHDKLESFIEKTDSLDKWKPLNERARKYLDEINKTIGV